MGDLCRIWCVDLEVTMRPRLLIFLRPLFAEGIKFKSYLLELKGMSSVGHSDTPIYQKMALSG